VNQLLCRCWNPCYSCPTT